MATQTTPSYLALARRDRSRDRRRDSRRTASAEQRTRADRVRELRQPRRPRGRRLGADEQVRRGLSGQALLRRLRVRGRRRARGDRARQGAVRRRTRQRAAALGRAGEHGGLPDAAAARRHGARHEPRARRPPHARAPAEFFGQALHDRAVRRAERRRAHRLRRAGPPRRRAQAEDDHRRRERVPARDRFRAASAAIADRVGAPVFTDMAHIAGLVAAGVHPSPGAALRLRDDDHAQDAARARAAAWSSAASGTRRTSIAPSSRACRADR